MFEEIKAFGTKKIKAALNRQFAVLFIITILLLTFSDGQQISQKGSSTKFVNDIRQVDFNNFTYKRDDRKTKIVTLTDGKYINSNTDAELYLMRIAHGDLTGDGSDEAAILLRSLETRAGGKLFDEVFIFTLKNREAVALTHFETGRSGDYVLSIESLGSNFKIENGFLVLDQAILRAGEFAPTHFYTVKYRWNGVQMAEAERSRLNFLPENMREVG